LAAKFRPDIVGHGAHFLNGADQPFGRHSERAAPELQVLGFMHIDLGRVHGPALEFHAIHHLSLPCDSMRQREGARVAAASFAFDGFIMPRRPRGLDAATAQAGHDR
jgi:hypothetical protein